MSVDQNKQALIDKWNQRYAGATEPGTAVQVLRGKTFLLPVQTKGQGQDQIKALDLACGLGANAVLLAQQGFTVDAWDLSPVAIEFLKKYSEQHDLSIRPQCRDVEFDPPGDDSYDVIVVSYFLERGLFPVLLKALRPGGVLFYQTFIQDKALVSGPTNPAYLLGDNELLKAFKDLRVLYYEELGSVGDITQGLRNEAMLVASKPEEKV
jgi:2-polyprenyl-3-methyl-5-hydroxy-6-metoxy-1,4-benzoquinol methylase